MPIMFKIKPSIIKAALEISSISLIVFILILSVQSLLNFFIATNKFSDLKESVQYQINTMNSLSSVENIEKTNQSTYLNIELQKLDKIKKNENGEIKNVIFETNIKELTYNKYIANIVMNPSSHTCLFLDKINELKGKTEISALVNGKNNCSKDVLLIKYFIP